MRCLWVALCVLWATWGVAQEAAYIVTGGQRPVDVVANGYVQSVTSVSDDRAEVRVAAILGPIGSEGTYEEIRNREIVGVPPDFDLPARLRSELRPELSAWEAATRILEWSARYVRVDVSDNKPQDAVSVLARGHGRCSGVANATTALLLAAGFEAATVSGLLISDNGWIPHRWVACRLPGAGWVHTDPTLGLWTVTANHVAFDDAVEDPPAVKVVQEPADGLSALPRRGGRPMRPNLGSDLVCRVVGEGDHSAVVAILRGGAGAIHRVALDPEGRFTALLPGRWRLTVMAGDVVIEERELELQSGQLQSFVVTLPVDRVEHEVGS